MTSKNCSSKSTLKSSIAMIFDTLHKNAWLPTLSFLIFFFSLPVAVALTLQNHSIDSTMLLSNGLTSLQNNLVNFFHQNNMFLPIILILLAISAAGTFFRYLQDATQVDFYHGLPIKRQHLFFINIKAGAVAVMLPYLVNVLLALVVSYLMVGSENVLLLPILQAVCFHIVGFAAVYLVAVLAAMLTGSRIVQLAFSALLLGIGPALIGCYVMVMQTFHTTYYDIGNILNYVIHSSPAAFYLYWAQQDENRLISFLGLAVLVIIGYLVCRAFYLKRPSEAAGSAIAFKWVKPVLGYPLTVVATIFFGLIFYNTGSYTRLWLIFGFAAGGLICNRIIEIIAASDFRAIKKHWLGLVIYAVLFAAVISVPVFDLTDYDGYVPEAAKVESVQIYFNSYNNYNNNHALLSATGQTMREMDYDQYNLAFGRLQERSNIDAAIACAQIASQKNMSTRYGQHATEAANETIYYQRNKSNTAMSIVYTTTAGRTICRQYSSVLFEDLKEPLDIIGNSAEFRTNQYPLTALDSTLLDIASIESYNNFTTDSIIYGTQHSTDEIQTVIAAYQKDLAAFTHEQRWNELPYGSIRFTIQPTAVKGNNPARAEMENSAWKPGQPISSSNTKDWVELDEYPIYPSFTNTLAALSELGYPVNSYFTPQAAQVSMIKVEIDRNSLEDSGVLIPQVADKPTFTEEESGAIYSEIITDPAEIQKVLDNSYPSDAYGLSSLIALNPAQTLHVIFKENKETSQLRYYPLR